MGKFFRTMEAVYCIRRIRECVRYSATKFSDIQILLIIQQFCLQNKDLGDKMGFSVTKKGPESRATVLKQV